MNQNKRPTLEELSLYYDGLLEGNQKDWVEEWLQKDQSSRQMLNLFHDLECAAEPNLSEDELNQLLGNTVQQVHERILQEPRRQDGWFFLFKPRWILTALGTVLLFAVVFTQWETGNIISNDHTAQVHQNKETNLADLNAKIERPELSPVQKQAMLALGNSAKSYFDKGLNYATERTQKVKETLSNESDVLTSAQEKMIKEGQRQIAIGLGASVLTLLTVF